MPPPTSELREASAGSAAADPTRLAAGFGALVVLTYGLIVLGALVRAHGAGLACPDWPLCFGEVIPRFDLKVAFEWGHRVVAGTVALVFAGLAVGVLRDPRWRARAGGIVAVAAGLLALQILLGALTVWKLLASWTVTSHLLTGNAFAASLLLAARSLAAAPPSEPRPSTAAHAAVAVATLVLLVQMLLGGLVSSNYAGVVCPEWPACRDGVWFPGFDGALAYHLLHRLGAYTLLAALAVAAFAARGSRIASATALALGLGVVQVGVGVANVLLRIPIELTGLHSALAAALVLTLTWILHAAWQREQPAGADAT